MNKETTLSVFVDESGRFQYPDRESRFYIVGMVFHDQSADITQAIHDFNKSIYSLGLDPTAFVFHAGPLVRREKGYEFFSRNHRGKIYNRMMTFARRIDFRWHCLCCGIVANSNVANYQFGRASVHASRMRPSLSRPTQDLWFQITNRAHDDTIAAILMSF